jgi:hypothetical protein
MLGADYGEATRRLGSHGFGAYEEWGGGVDIIEEP